MGDYAKTCQSANALVGNIECAPRIEQVSMLIFADETKSYNLSSYATDALFLAALQADTIATGTSRTRPVKLTVGGNFTNSADPSIINGGYGGVFSILNGKVVFEMELPKNAFYMRAQLAMLNNSNTLSAFIGDKSAKLWGRGSHTDFRGFDVDGIEVMKYEGVAGTTDAPMKVRVHFRDEDMFLDGNLYHYVFAKSVYPFDNLFAIKPVVLELVSASATTVVVKARLQGSRLCMGVNYETGMELPAAWTFPKASDGTAQTISGVVYNSTAETFTLSGTGLVSGPLNLVSASALAALASPIGAASTGGFESLAIDVTI